jgi:hypothetical protein
MRATSMPLLSALLLLAPSCDSKKDEAPKDSATAGQAEAKADAKDAEPQPEEAPEEAPPARKRKWGAELCDTIIPCYQQNKFSGNFSADVSIDIEPDGSVSAVSFTGEAPKPVETCIVDTIKGTTLSDYSGKPGRTRCTKSGQLSGGSQMVMSDVEHEERDPSAKPEEEAAGDAPEGDEPAED